MSRHPVLREVLRSQPGPLAGGVAAGLAWQIAVAAVPILLGVVVDRAIVDGDTVAVWWGAAALFGVGVVTAAADAARHWCETTAQARTTVVLWDRISATALRADGPHRDRWPASEVVARSTADVEAVATAAGSVSWIVAQAAIIPVVLTALVVIDPVLALVAVLAAVVAVSAMWWGSVAWKRHSEQTSSALAAYVADAHAVLSGFVAIRGAGADDGVLRGIERRSEAVRDRYTRAGRWWLFFTPVLEVCSGITVIALLWVGGERVVDGGLGVGEVVAAIGLALVLVEPMGSVGYGIVALRSAVVSGGRLAELGDPGEPEDAVGPTPPLGEGLVAVDLMVRHPDRVLPILDGLDHHFAPGRPTLVVGPVGSGKTTLTELLAGDREPTRGEVRLGDRPLRDLSPDERRRAVLRLGPEPFLLAATLAENLRLGAPAAPDADLLTALRLARADDLLAALPDGLDTVLADRGVSLSGGERQRIALARAVLARPAVLILDGATGGLEPVREHALLAGLSEAWRSGVLVVVSANPLLRGRFPDVLALDAPVWHGAAVTP